MEKRLHLLESFHATGSDGVDYYVHGYEHLGRIEPMVNAQEHWEPLGVAEYKLADGRGVTMRANGSLYITDSGIELAPAAGHH